MAAGDNWTWDSPVQGALARETRSTQLTHDLSKVWDADPRRRSRDLVVVCRTELNRQLGGVTPCGQQTAARFEFESRGFEH
jgi:hypothetical protein